MRPRFWHLIPLILFAALACFLWLGLSRDPQLLPSTEIGKPLPGFILATLSEKTDVPFSPSDMRGNIALLNVWASWCPACREEQVFLLQLARDGVSVFGLNYKDKPEEAKQWLLDWGNPYKKIGIDRDGRVAIDLGVYGAPETFLLDKQGIIRYRHVGTLDASIWQHDFLPRIKSMQAIS